MTPSTLMERALASGIYMDAEMADGVPVRGIGTPWFPPQDMPLIHCEAIYQMAQEASDGTSVSISAFNSAGERKTAEDLAAARLRAQQTQSHLEQLLAAFDDGPEEHNPPMLCPFAHVWLEFSNASNAVMSVATIASDADAIGHINAWHIVQRRGGPILMVASARYWDGGLQRATQLSAAGNKEAGLLLDFLDRHHRSLYGFDAPQITGARPGEHGDAIADHLVDDMRLRLATCGAVRIPNTRGVSVQPVDARVGKKQKRLRPHQQIRRHVLTITGSEGGVRRVAARGHGESLTAEHLVRAHWVCYSEDSPMFGIPGRHGWWRRQAHKRGKRANGLVRQTRRIEPS